MALWSRLFQNQDSPLRRIGIKIEAAIPDIFPGFVIIQGNIICHIRLKIECFLVRNPQKPWLSVF
jgi:hypothetical protein